MITAPVLIGAARRRRSTTRRRRLSAALAPALALIILLAPAPRAGADDRILDFDAAPAPAVGASVVGQYHGQGVDFESLGDDAFPKIRDVGAQAHSGTRIAGEDCGGVEFCANQVLGHFATTRSHVRVWVGDYGPATASAVITLTGFDAGGNTLGTDSATVHGGAGFSTPLDVASPAGDIAGFRVSPGTPANVPYGIDDLTFDLPAGAPAPDFGLSATAPPLELIRPGESVAVPITIAHVNGGTGSVKLAVSGLPAGVTGAITPADTSGNTATLSLTAAPDASATAVTSVIVKGVPSSPAVGPGLRTATFALRVANGTKVSIDVARVTQGLDRDVRAAVDYDLVAGKDALVRTQLSGPGAPAIDAAECRIDRAGAPASTVPAMWTGSGTPRANATAVGHFDGSPTFDCRVPGSLTRTPGVYTFSFLARPQDSLSFSGGMVTAATFKASADIRLLIYPWLLPPGDPQYRPYTPASLVTLARSLADFQRIWPARAGVGSVMNAPPAPGAVPPGVRYYVAPPFQCLSHSATSTLACDTQTRNLAELARTTANATATYDRYDWAYTLAQVPNSGGGSSCWSGNTAGGAQDLRPPETSYQANIMVQELAHCLGAVEPGSPNSDPMNPLHARTVLIPMAGQPPGVNMLTGNDVLNPTSVMYPFVTQDATAFFEGREWNHVRAGTVSSSLGVASGAAAKSRWSATSRAGSAGRLRRTFVWMGTITRTGRARVQYAFARRGLLEPTISGQLSPSPYQLVFRGAHDDVLSRRAVSVSFNEPHEPPLPSVPVFVEAALPRGATSVALLAGSRQLYHASLRGSAPVVRAVDLRRSPAGLVVSWRATDSDSSALRYAVSYKRPGQPPLVLSAGLGRRTYVLRTRFLGATSAGRVLVEASDGVHVGRARSRAFIVRASRPVAQIVAPASGDRITAGRVSLTGAAFDTTEGVLRGRAMRWMVDGRLRATGTTPVVALTAGRHRIELHVRTHAGRTTIVRRTVLVS